ncbi:hypothetical protein EDC91_12066 [Shewanella fodinae]|uniref:Uncharacterized protein n=1 Tax=Shewanella fodinae TaxID=552357 RepID=A0A4V2RS18_9GAMM|nr:hypothetical protein EDC91_12066 [Shewanella fodinae]
MSAWSCWRCYLSLNLSGPELYNRESRRSGGFFMGISAISCPQLLGILAGIGYKMNPRNIFLQ